MTTSATTTQQTFFGAEAPDHIAPRTGVGGGDGVSHPATNDAETSSATGGTFFDFPIQVATDSTPSLQSLHDYRYDPQYDYPTMAFCAGESLLLIGPPGCGKTTYARYLAHKMGLRYHQQPHNAQMEVEDIHGSWKPGIVDGQATYVYKWGPLVDFYKNGGIFNADEITAAKPNTTHVYHPIANREMIYVEAPDGTIAAITPHPHFRLIATCNPWGQYEGNYEMNGALFERFMPVRWDYLTPEFETEALLLDGPNVSPGIIEDLVKFANNLRASYKASKGNQRYVLSTRVLRRMVSHMNRFDVSLDAVVAHHIQMPLEAKYPDEYDAVMKTLTEFIALSDPIAA